MGLMSKGFRISELNKKRELTKSSPDFHPSIMSDKLSQREKSIWRRISGKNIHLSSVNEQTAEMAKTIDHAITQLHEAQRLRHSKTPLIDHIEMLWMDKTILDVEIAALDVATLLEPVRVERETMNGRLGLVRQFRWVYRDSERARDMTSRLLACHSSLMVVLARLQRLDTPEPTTVPVHELEAEMPYKTGMYSPSSLIDSASCLSESEENNNWNSLSPSFLNHEMNDMLAWRRSKGKAL